VQAGQQLERGTKQKTRTTNEHLYASHSLVATGSGLEGLDEGGILASCIAESAVGQAWEGGV
jgi:hypothetical protein